MRKLKHVIYCLLFFLTVSTISPALAQAPVLGQIQTPPPQTKNSNYNIIYSNVENNVPRNLNTLTQNTIISVLSSAVCMLSGMDPLDPENGRCLGINTKTGTIGYTEKGSGGIQLMAGLIGGTFSIPISGSDYAVYALDNFGVTKKAFAQTKNETQFGVGFNRLKPLVTIWSRFRDIAYLAFVLAFTIIGLAIMFRVKIDARTVMTIQNQIPKIVIALVLVTFSYAIAGFMIDLMYVAMYLIILTFNTLTPTNIDVNANIFGVVNKAFSVGWNTPVASGNIPGIIGLTGELSWGVSRVMGELATDFLSSTISAFFQSFFVPFQAISSIGCGAFSIISTGGLGLIGYIPIVGDLFKSIPGIGGLFGGASCNFLETFFKYFFISLFTIITFLIILVTILFSLFRVWFTLIKSFAYVLADAMIAPLWIAAGIFPGSKLTFTTWLRHLSGHLSVFPMTFAVIFLGKTMMDAVSSGNGQLFSPPLIGSQLGGNSIVAAFIGFGFIISLHSILDKTRKVVGAFDFGLADIKSSFGAGFQTPRSAAGTAIQSQMGTPAPGEKGFWKTIARRV